MLLIVPDQKVVVGASLMQWLKVVEMRQLSAETAGVCICRRSDAQVSRGQEWRFRSERDSTLEAPRSLLYIEVGECRVVVMAHVYPSVTKSWEV